MRKRITITAAVAAGALALFGASSLITQETSKQSVSDTTKVEPAKQAVEETPKSDPKPRATCVDVTSYDYNWDNDMLCTLPDGSKVYTSYEGAQAYEIEPPEYDYDPSEQYDAYDEFDQY